jgi:F-type H+-transporting ATPase subunit b
MGDGILCMTNCIPFGVKCWRGTITVIGALSLLCLFDVVPVFASEGEAAGGWGIWEAIGRIFNLALVVAVLVYVLRRPLGLFFEERRQNIHASLENALRAKNEAEGKLAEMQRRMNSLDDELQAIRRKAQLEIEEERKRSQMLAEQEAERIVSVARREADSLVRAATLELRSEAARLAVELAEKRIKSEINPEIEGRLIKNFLEHLEKAR